MKLIVLLLSISILSCNSNKPDEITFNTWLLIHNQKAHTRFFNDSINQDTDMRIKYARLGIPNDLDAFKTSGQVLENNWNDPYKIENDYHLTLDKYMEYCKANGKDPKTFFKFID